METELGTYGTIPDILIPISHSHQHCNKSHRVLLAKDGFYKYIIEEHTLMSLCTARQI